MRCALPGTGRSPTTRAPAGESPAAEARSVRRPRTMDTALLLPLALLALQTPVPDSLAQLILSLEAQRRAAHLSGNAEQLASILADDFVDIGANGVHRTKQQNVEDTRAHVIQWMRLVAKNEHVQVFDSTAAVVTGEQEGAGTYRGQPFARTTRYLRVYLKRGGRWQNVAAESALIAP